MRHSVTGSDDHHPAFIFYFVFVFLSEIRVREVLPSPDPDYRKVSEPVPRYICPRNQLCWPQYAPDKLLTATPRPGSQPQSHSGYTRALTALTPQPARDSFHPWLTSASGRSLATPIKFTSLVLVVSGASLKSYVPCLPPPSATATRPLAASVNLTHDCGR